MTQGALGAGIATVAAPREARWWAAGLGWFAGMAPDLDVLIRSSSDPLLFLEYHRQFTHALLFIPVGALACALAAHAVVRQHLRFRATCLFCCVGYASHGLLDACTSYGTQLLWPFSDIRVAWNVVSVVDPLFTLPLLALLAAALVTGRSRWGQAALLWAVVYLGVGAIQHQRARVAAAELAAARGHVPDALLVKPSFANLLVWKTVYAADGRFHVDAVRVGAQASYFAGAAITGLDVAVQLPWVKPGSRQGRDVRRFARFSDGFLALDPDHPNRVIDVRYSMVPNRIAALWGIELDPEDARAAPRFVTERSSTRAERLELLRMIASPGRTLDALQNR